MELKDCLAHFPKKISNEIKKYAIDNVFKYSRYIFTRREGKRQYGYCTHCKREFKTDGFRHNTKEECPKCHSACYVKASGRGRKGLIDEAYFVYYGKSLINPNVIIAQGIYAVRDYSGDYHNVETKYLVRAWYLFKTGNSVMFARSGYYSAAKTMQSYSTQECSSVFSLYSQYNSNYRNIILECSRESIEKAVKDTQFQYSTWNHYLEDDMVKFFALYAKYPCIEYLTKFGLGGIVEAKLNGGLTYNAINWRGTTFTKVLRLSLSKSEIAELKANDHYLNPLFIRLLQISKKDGSNLPFQELFEIEREYAIYYKDLQGVLKYTTLRKVNAFISKQFTQKNHDKKHYYSKTQTLITWKDYIADCIRLEMDLTKECVLFPSNLYQAHQNTIKQVKLKEDQLLNSKIATRIKALAKYCFDYAGLLLRPANSSKELIEEGKALNHCVGTYADRYAKGETNIFLIRKVSEPDKPYFTMEVRQDSIVQVRGNRNCDPSGDVKEFIKVFTSEKLTKSKAKVAV